MLITPISAITAAHTITCANAAVTKKSNKKDNKKKSRKDIRKEILRKD